MAKTSIQNSIVFNINGGKRRKTQLTLIASPSQEPSKTPQRRTTTASSLGSPQQSGGKASISSTTDLLTPAALQCAPFELSLLILETCCLFNVWMEVVQASDHLYSKLDFFILFIVDQEYFGSPQEPESTP